MLEDGNTLYRKNRFEEAAHRYGYAVRRIPIDLSNNNNNSINNGNVLKDNKDSPYDDMGNNNDSITLTDDSMSSVSMTFSQLKIHLLLNLSRCQRRLGNRIM